MFRIKICGIRNVSDALAAAEAGADAIGLNFYTKSRRFVGRDVAREIVDAMPAGMLKVGVFVNQDPAEIAAIASEVGLDAVQLHGDEAPEVVARLTRRVRVVRAERCGAGGLEPMARYIERCAGLGRLPDAMLIDADAGMEFGGTGKVANWDLITDTRFQFASVPIILAGGLSAQNVAAAISAVRPNGVDVASGVEQSPGVKDHEFIRQFVKAARRAFDGQ
jgi:phosphoribosylanthranilate isomerase